MLHLIQRMTSVKPGSAFYERALVHKSDCIYVHVTYVTFRTCWVIYYQVGYILLS